MKYFFSISALLLLSACGNNDRSPELSDAAATTTLYSSTAELPSHCIGLGSAIGYGSSKSEAQKDLRYQAHKHLAADSVVLSSLAPFFQDQRLSNYFRTPEMKAPKGTRDYYYKDAFNLQAKGQAYNCHLTPDN